MREIHLPLNDHVDGPTVVLIKDGSEEAEVLHELLADLEADHALVQMAWMRGEQLGIKVLDQEGQEMPVSAQMNPEGVFKLVDTLHGLIKEGRPLNALNVRLYQLIHRHPLMLFIKGTPQQPRCGFTRELLTLLGDQLHLEFDTFDILGDEGVRQGLKEYSQWPTFPQVYVRGELVGGLDICRELIEAGEFTLMLTSTSS